MSHFQRSQSRFYAFQIMSSPWQLFSVSNAAMLTLSSDTTSLLEGYRGYLEHGRTYQAKRNSRFEMPPYMIQCQAMEANHLVHFILNCQAPNSLFLAPIRPNPKHIFYLGTGQGQWVCSYSTIPPALQLITGQGCGCFRSLSDGTGVRN